MVSSTGGRLTVDRIAQTRFLSRNLPRSPKRQPAREKSAFQGFCGPYKPIGIAVRNSI